MEAIRKAISMPTLCSSDTVMPHSCARRGCKAKRRKRRKSKTSGAKGKTEEGERKPVDETEAISGDESLEGLENISNEAPEAGDKDGALVGNRDNALAGGTRSKPASMSFVKLRIMTWSRLIDSRGGSSNKIHPMLEEDGPGPPRNYGSSVDLAPTLMSIYDNYASTSECQVYDEYNHNAPPETSSTEAAPQAAVPSPGLSYGKDDIDNLAVVGSGPGVVISSQNVSHEKKIHSRQGISRSTLMDTEMKDCSTENDGPPAALSTISSHTSHHSDVAKKRPLSVSSTSSATSTSSLPRQQRKKVAGNNNPTSSLALNRCGGVASITSGSVSTVSPVMTSQTSIATSDIGIMDTLTDEEGVEDYTKCRTRSNVTTLPSPESRDQFEPDEINDCHSGAQMSYIDKVVAEILETERTYVHDLNEIIKGYLYEFRDDSSYNMDDSKRDALFGNIEEIRNFNKLFLAQLECCQQDAVRLAKCFVDNNEGFVIYSDYCTNYPGAVEVLTSVMADTEKADVFKHRQLALGHTLPLGAYLLKPVQRILKYHLLLQNILSHMRPDSEDKHVVEQALSSMTNMAQHINEMKRKHEHAVRIQELQAMLCEWDGPDFNTYGDLVKEETFKMHGAKGDRQLILFERGLLIAKRKEDSGLLIKDCIMCSNLMLVERIPKEPLSFHVIPFDNPRGQYTFQARCLDQKREWCQELKRLILESYTADKAIPKNVIELVMQLTSKDEKDLNEPGIASALTRKPCPKPQYLEKKKRRKSVTAVLSDLSSIRSHVTKRVLTRRSDGSPRPSPRVHRRRSDSAVPRETMRHLMEKQKKRALLSEADDGSDTDSTGRTQYCSLESIHAPDDSACPARAPQRLSAPSGSGAAGACSDLGTGDESGLESVETTPTTSPPYLNWSRPGGAEGGSYSPLSPVRRRESFRIATTQHPLETRLGGQGLRPTSALGTSQTNKEKKLRYLLRSRRRVSESDLGMITNNLEEEQVDKEEGYTSLSTSCRLANGNEGDDECDNDDPIYFNVNHQRTVSLVEDEEGDYVELPIYQQQSPSHGDSNNNTQNQRPSRIASQRARSVESSQRGRGPVGSGYLITKGLRGAAKSGHRDNDRSKSPSRSVERTKRNPLATRLHERNLSESGARYDNVLCSRGLERSGRSQRERQRWISPQRGREMIDSVLQESYANSSISVNFNNNMSTNSQSKTTRRNDPWIPRTAPPAKKVDRVPRQRERSNSLSSLSDYIDDIHQIPSDFLVFTNRNAFVTSANPQTIRHDLETERAIARFATPPRELGPSDIIQVINESKEHGKIVTRYATPPRSFEDTYPIESSSSVHANSNTGDQLYSRVWPTRPTSPGAPGLPTRRTLPADMRYSGLSFWTDFEDYLSHSTPDTTGSVPKFPVSCTSVSGHEYFGQCSSPGAVSSSHSSSVHSPSPSSPSSVTSNESLVDTFKQKVFNLTSLIASHLPRSVESTPKRTPRSRSFGALEDLRVDQSPEPKSSSRKKEKRGRFVSSLARVYSDRQKRSSATPSDEFNDQHVERDSTDVSKQLTTLLKESKPGSSVIGERMAASKPIVLGTYTLPRHRNQKANKTEKDKPKPKPTEVADNDAGDAVIRRRVPGQKPETESTDSSGYDSGVKDLAIEGDNVEHSLETTLAAFNQAFSGLDTNEFNVREDDSMYYYERRFVEDLESNFGSELFRDSAVYSDDGSPVTDSDPQSPNVSIRETVKLIEQRSKLKALPRTEIKEEEKAKGIKNILKTLEAANTISTDAHGKGRCEADQGVVSDKATMKTVRDRTRELIECATLARIRQDACQVVEDLPTVEDEAAGVEGVGSPPLRRGRSRSRRW